MIWQFDQDYPTRIPSDEALGIDHVAIKTHDGTTFMGAFDRHPKAIRDITAFQRLVDDYQSRGIEVSAWCVPTGRDPVREAKIAIEVLRVVPTLILDVEVEGSSYFWKGTPRTATEYLDRIKQAVPEGRLVLQYDVRGSHPREIGIESWLPFVDLVCSMTYWTTFRVPWRLAIEEAVGRLQDTGKEWTITIPADEPDPEIYRHVLSRLSDRALVLVWRRGTMTQACQGIFRKPVIGVEDKITDLYEELVRRSVQLEELGRRVARLEGIVSDIREVLIRWYGSVGPSSAV
jgi:hypothetical protein